MIHKQIRISFVLALAGWIAAIAVWVVSWISDSAHLGQLGLLIGMAAGSWTIRVWMCDSVRDVQNSIRIVREVEARDSVRPLR